ncbi:MAG: sigma-54-dependent Fis family transcriptional regulator [Alphaproteobacteria bacterium]|nr:sigma-54-dependent Fis family transcriptional regulator [Alphaproteobacteria bacterium]
MELLIVGTLNGQIGAASKIAISKGGQVSLADSVEKAVEILCSGKNIELIMVDVTLDVHKLISSLEQSRINVLVVACGVANDTSLAVKAIKAGAKEYIPLPPDPELIGAVLAAATRENHALIYGDKKTEAILKMAKQIAPSEASVLLTGSSGTGKEIFSRFVHDNSKRANQKFVAVNCAAIPEALLESELFGYEKGAFTGAVSRRIGKFEEASGGTLLLDEISEMDIGLQAKLLRAIQEKEIDRLGGKSPIKVDTRIIATSNRDLEKCTLDGTFRQDLYYRLNVININIPDLKDRVGDIVVLAKHFIKKYSELNDLPMKDLSAKAEEILLNYLWPGNVRELENTMHRAVLLSTGDEIGEEAIILQTPSAVRETKEQVKEEKTQVGKTVAEVERKLILDTMEDTMWNRSQAATILGISIRTLRNKLKQYQEEGYSIHSSSQG